MNERIHRCLDGELPRSELRPEEIREIEAYEAILRETKRTHRSVAVPDLTARVRAQLAREIPARETAPLRHSAAGGKTRVGKVSRWLWAPRPVRLRPVWGVLAATVCSLVLVLLLREGPAPSADSVAAPTPQVFVQFRLDAPGASAVRLAGNFTGWEPTYQLNQTAPGVWSIMIPLEPGVYDYNFVVNGGEWVPDPVAPAVDDGFGGLNSRLSVLLPADGARRL